MNLFSKHNPKRFFLSLLIFTFFLPSFTYGDQSIQFTAVRKPLPEWVVKRMKRHSWREGCPVPLEDLRYIYMKHWGFDGNAHNGRLVVHRNVVDEVIQIFEALYEQRFPIERMALIDDFNGSDEASMAANNTSAFNCRNITGKVGVFSRHSYGTAIDINPVRNPYVSNERILPPEGVNYVNRRLGRKGMVVKGDLTYQAFIQRGWVWGGEWRSFKDYQHFQKSGN